MSSEAGREARVDYQHSYELRADDTRRFLQFLKNTWRDLGVDITADTLRVRKSRPGEMTQLDGELVVEETRVDEIVQREQYLPDSVVSLLAAVGLVVVALGAWTPSVTLVGVGIVAVAVAGALSVYDQPRRAEREYDTRTEVTARIELDGTPAGSTADADETPANSDDTTSTGDRTAHTGERSEGVGSVENAESTRPATPTPSDDPPADGDSASSSRGPASPGPASPESTSPGPASSGPSPRPGPASSGPSPRPGPASSGPSPRPDSVARAITVVVETSVSTPYPDATRPVVEERLQTVDDRLTEFFDD